MKSYAALAVLIFSLPSVQAQDLLSVYEQALQRDPSLHQAESTRNAALESKPQSIARLLPSIALSANLNRNWVTTNSSNPTQSLLAGGNEVTFWSSSSALTLNQPLYHHELWVQLSQADNQVAQAEATYAAALQDVIVRSASAYFNILFAQDSLEFARMERQSIERQLEQAKARFEVGLIAVTDVDAAQAGFDQARSNAIKAENDLDNAREAMREIIGEFEGAIAGLVGNAPLQAPEPAEMEHWSQRAQANNPLIIAAQNQADLAQKTIDLQFAGHLPTIDLVASAGFNDNNRPNGIRTENQVIGVQLNLPLFQGGLVNSRVRQAREQYQAAQDNLDMQRRAANKQVKIAYRGIMTSISQIAALQSAMASAQSALQATEAGFEVGTRTMIDVLLLQSKLYQAKRDYAKARYDYVINSLSLKQASGLLQREDVEWVNRWLGKP